MTWDGGGDKLKRGVVGSRVRNGVFRRGEMVGSTRILRAVGWLKKGRKRNLRAK
jgi:hypothetical protein